METEMEIDDKAFKPSFIVRDLATMDIDDNAKEKEDLVKAIDTFFDKYLQALAQRREDLKREALWRITSHFKRPTAIANTIEAHFPPIDIVAKLGFILTRTSLLPKEIFNRWLPKKNFTLLYKASRDGFQAKDFHNLCDDKGPTLTIISSHPHNYLFGGYSPIPWKSLKNTYEASTETFIFTITNPHGIPPTMFPIKVTKHAVCYNEGYGPIFGGGNDINISNNSNTNSSSYTQFPHSYYDTAGKGNITFTGQCNFTANDIEVYYVHL